MTHKGKRFAALALVLSLLLSLLSACGKKNTATSMHLVKTEGTVQVKNERGKTVTAVENLGLYSGYGVATLASSYGWISLDDTKLAKMDAGSEVEIQKSGKALEINVRSGSLFFDISKPLEDDETLNIRTSSMVVGIRGTRGWVEVENEEVMCVYLLKGRVECAAMDTKGNVLATEAIVAGEAALMESGGDITVAEFDPEKVPGFVEEELSGLGDLPDHWTYDAALKGLAQACLLYAQDSSSITAIDKQVNDRYAGERFKIEFSRLLTVHHDLGGSPATALDAYSYAYYDLNGDGMEELWLSHDGQLALMYYIHYPYADSANAAQREIWYVADTSAFPILYGGDTVICANGAIVTRPRPGAAGTSTIYRWQFEENHGTFKTVYSQKDATQEDFDKMLERCGGERTEINFRWHPLSDFARRIG